MSERGEIGRCPNCQKDFVFRSPRQRCCSKACGNQLWYSENRVRLLKMAKENRANIAVRDSKWKRERYHSDPVYRSKQVEYARQWRRREAAKRAAARNANARS